MTGENLLIDTQSFIWFVENNPKLPVFDRIIISQGITEKMQVVTSDSEFSNYKVNLIKF